jgi:hypothetical protein
MTAEDVTATLNLALKASGLDYAKVIQKPRLLSDSGKHMLVASLALADPKRSLTFGDQKVSLGWKAEVR